MDADAPGDPPPPPPPTIDNDYWSPFAGIISGLIAMVNTGELRIVRATHARSEANGPPIASTESTDDITAYSRGPTAVRSADGLLTRVSELKLHVVYDSVTSPLRLDDEIYFEPDGRYYSVLSAQRVPPGRAGVTWKIFAQAGG